MRIPAHTTRLERRNASPSPDTCIAEERFIRERRLNDDVAATPHGRARHRRLFRATQIGHLAPFGTQPLDVARFVLLATVPHQVKLSTSVHTSCHGTTAPRDDKHWTRYALSPFP